MTPDTRRSWWCRLGLHRWCAVTFREIPWVSGRRCERCEKVQSYFWPHCVVGWSKTYLTPNHDSDGYH